MSQPTNQGRRGRNSKRKLRSRARSTLVGLSFLILHGQFWFACGGISPEQRRANTRLIQREPPLTDLDPRSILSTEVVFDWQLGGPDLPVEMFTTSPNVHLDRSDQGIILTSDTARSWLEIPVDLPSASVTAIEIRTDVGRAVLSLGWSGNKETPTPLKATYSIECGSKDQVGSHYFDLTGHPAWKDPITRLKLRLRVPKKSISLHSITGLRETPNLDELRSVAARPWKLEIDNEVRNVLLAVPGFPFDWETLVPAKSTLRFDTFATDDTMTPIRFDLWAKVAGDSPRRLFSRLVADQATGTWTEALVDLAPFARKNVHFSFQVHSGHALALGNGFAHWGNPEIISKAPIDEAPNIVLVSLDTLRADHLSCYGYERETSPNLDRWAERGIVFENVVAPAPWTQPSHVSMFTGLDAHRHGTNRFQTMPSSVPTLPEVLRDSGYATIAVTGSGVMNARYGFSRGFDSYYHQLDSYRPGAIEKGVEIALQRVKQVRGRPFFLFFHTYEIHSPYVPRKAFFDRFTAHSVDLRVETGPLDHAGPAFLYWDSSEPRSVKRPLPPELSSLPSDIYDSAIAEADFHLGRFLDDLDEAGLLRNTIIVITSDHGELLGEHDVSGHVRLYEENLLVPLIVILPESHRAGSRIPTQVRLIDVAPTLMELANISSPSTDGASLLPLIETGRDKVRRPAWSYANWHQNGISLRLNNQLKITLQDSVTNPDFGTTRLFEIESDPTESRDIADTSTWTEPLTELVRKELAEAAGFRLRFENSGRTALAASLRSRPGVLDALSLSYPSTLPTRSDGDVVEMDLLPGSDSSLLIRTAPGTGRIHLRFWSRDDPTANITRKTLALEESPQRIEWPDGFARDLTVSLTWQGPSHQHRNTNSREDPENLQALKALGYID